MHPVLGDHRGVVLVHGERRTAGPRVVIVGILHRGLGAAHARAQAQAGVALVPKHVAIGELHTATSARAEHRRGGPASGRHAATAAAAERQERQGTGMRSQNGDLTAPSAPASTTDALVSSVELPAGGVIGFVGRELRVVLDESVVACRAQAFHDGIEDGPRPKRLPGYRDVSGERRVVLVGRRSPPPAAILRVCWLRRHVAGRAGRARSEGPAGPRQSASAARLCSASWGMLPR